MSSKRPVRRDGAAEGKPDRKIKVFYDGQCPMSASVIGCVGRSSKCGEFDLRDIHAEKRLPFKREAVQNEIHVVGRDGLVYKGAHGLLKIAGAYRGLTFVEQIGAFPLVRPLLPISYRFVAANLRLLFGPARRLFWLKVIVVLAFCLGLAMSPHLWIGPRSYPMAPLFDSLPEAGHPVDTTMFAALFVLAGVMLVWPSSSSSACSIRPAGSRGSSCTCSSSGHWRSFPGTATTWRAATARSTWRA
jgi:predicted DCC family thiol-disulfide oxidoreductase YuxK